MRFDETFWYSMSSVEVPREFVVGFWRFARAHSVLYDRIGTVGKPAISGVPIGHIDEQWVLPIGLDAELDAGAHALTIGRR